MTKTEALRELESMGTEQNRKTYRRHGASGEVFGVSYANLGMLQKRIQVDHPLALDLWATKNHDARVLANMIADPDAMSAKELDRWIAEIDNHMLSESMTSMLLRGDHAKARVHAERWIDSSNEWICSTGWQIFGGLAGADHEFPDDYLLKRLGQIESTIQRSANRVRHAMVLALIGIGSRGPSFEEAAVAAACKIGPVHVNHGETNCVTPDPIPYLRQIAAHRSARSLAAVTAEAAKKAAAPRKARAPKARSKGVPAGRDGAPRAAASNARGSQKDRLRAASAASPDQPGKNVTAAPKSAASERPTGKRASSDGVNKEARSPSAKRTGKKAAAGLVKSAKKQAHGAGGAKKKVPSRAASRGKVASRTPTAPAKRRSSARAAR